MAGPTKETLMPSMEVNKRIVNQFMNGFQKTRDALNPFTTSHTDTNIRGFASADTIQQQKNSRVDLKCFLFFKAQT